MVEPNHSWWLLIWYCTVCILCNCGQSPKCRAQACSELIAGVAQDRSRGPDKKKRRNPHMHVKRTVSLGICPSTTTAFLLHEMYDARPSKAIVVNSEISGRLSVVMSAAKLLWIVATNSNQLSLDQTLNQNVLGCTSTNPSHTQKSWWTCGCNYARNISLTFVPPKVIRINF